MITYPDKSNLKLVRNVNSSPCRLESGSLGGPTGTQRPLKLSNAWPTDSLKTLVPTWPRNSVCGLTPNWKLKLLSFLWFLFFMFLYPECVVSQHTLYTVRSRCHVKWTYLLAEHKRAKRYFVQRCQTLLCGTEQDATDH